MIATDRYLRLATGAGWSEEIRPHGASRPSDLPATVSMQATEEGVGDEYG